ncbi:MAG TPA: hypothetical protein VFG63_00850 [Nocardioidaceae bacterium]|nr:hypothetical protein [Nocardioidaceae bacterium]
MGAIDTVVFQALTVVLTLIGLVTSGVLWRSRGPASGLRMLAISLLPAAAYLTGTLRLLWEIGDAVLSWAVRFAFSPFVWLGIVIAGVSAVLFAVGSAMRRRGIGTQGRAPRQSGRTERRTLPADSGRTAAQGPREGSRQGRAGQGGSGQGRAGQGEQTDDLADIEAILRKHGIS